MIVSGYVGLVAKLLIVGVFKVDHRSVTPLFSS